MSGFEQVKLRALAIHARHVADAANRLRELEQQPILTEPLIEARNLNLLRGAQL